METAVLRTLKICNKKKRKKLKSKHWNANIGITVAYNKIAPNWVLSGQISYPFTKKKKEKLLIQNEKKIKKMAWSSPVK